MNKLQEKEKAGKFRRHFVPPAVSQLGGHTQQEEEETRAEVSDAAHQILNATFILDL